MHRLILGRLYANQGPNSLDRLFLTIQELVGSVNTNALIVGRGSLVSLDEKERRKQSDPLTIYNTRCR